MIRLDSPRRWDIVSDKIMLAGVGTGFEATFAYRISDGHDEVASYIMAGGGTGENGQFQVVVDVSKASFKLDRVFVDLYEASAKDGSDLHKTTRPVLLGHKMVDGYYGFREHVVRAGETMTAIAEQHYGTKIWEPIARANNVPPLFGFDPNRILPGQVLRIPVGS